MGAHRTKLIFTLVAAAVLGTAGTAYAAGTYTAGTYQVVFFYDVSSGSGDSKDFSGYGSAALCADAPGATSNKTFSAYYRRNRTGLPDETLKTLGLAYNQAQYASGSFSTSSSSKYHTNAGWSYAGNLSGMPNGFSRATRTGTCTSP